MRFFSRIPKPSREAVIVLVGVLCLAVFAAVVGSTYSQRQAQEAQARAAMAKLAKPAPLTTKQRLALDAGHVAYQGVSAVMQALIGD
jgi:hypothetical protein